MSTEPQTALAAVNPITTHHGNIAEEFLNKVKALIAQEGLTIKKYAIEDDWRITESIELKVSDKQSLQIQLVLTK